MINKNTRRGFTLIELLVVVLIIGILAAVAVPQYQFALDKSRITPYLTKIQDIVKAENIYFLANGKYALNFTDLDIDLTQICPNKSGNNELTNCPGHVAIGIGSTSLNPQLFYCATSTCNWDSSSKLITIGFDNTNGNVSYCQVNNNNARGNKLCTWLKPE